MLDGDPLEVTDAVEQLPRLKHFRWSSKFGGRFDWHCKKVVLRSDSLETLDIWDLKKGDFFANIICPKLLMLEGGAGNIFYGSGFIDGESILDLITTDEPVVYREYGEIRHFYLEVTNNITLDKATHNVIHVHCTW
jgi:hypothetical protein